MLQTGCLAMLLRTKTDMALFEVNSLGEKFLMQGQM